jgi:hypothetical protein
MHSTINLIVTICMVVNKCECEGVKLRILHFTRQRCYNSVRKEVVEDTILYLKVTSEPLLQFMIWGNFKTRNRKRKKKVADAIVAEKHDIHFT